LAEVCRDRRLDNGAVGTRHQTTHTRQLADLCGRTTSTGVSVNVNGVERLLTLFLALLVDDRLCRQAVHHGFGNKIVGAGPDVDDLVVLLALRHQTGGILVLDLFNFRIRLRDDRGLFLRNDEVIDADGRAGTGRVLVTGVHQLVSEDHGLFQTDITITGVENAGDLFLGHLLVDHRERQPLRDDVEQQHTADSGFHHLAGLNLLTFTVVARAEHTRLDARLQMGVTGLVGTLHLGRIGEDHPLSLGIHTGTGHVVQPQNNVLGRHDDRFPAGGRQNVVGGHHQRTRFQLGFQGQRPVNGHLVTVEVGVIGSTDQRMQLDGLTFNQNGLERLDTESVQRWRTVEQYRVLPDHIGQDVPHLCGFPLHHLLGSLDGCGQTPTLEFAEDEGLEQLQRHLLGQAALMQLEGRTYHDHGTTGVVHSLTEQVLTEATLLALDHVSQRLQRTLVGTGDGATATTVVQQRVHRLLEHALLVAHDDVRRVQVEQTLEAVVAVDHTTIQIVQV